MNILKVIFMARIKPQTLLLQSKRKKGPTQINITTIIFCNLIVILIIMSLVATYRHWSQRSREYAETGILGGEDGDGILDSKKFDLPSYAVLNTSKGYITVELYKEGFPEVVDKFLDLCQKGNFKGMLFQRVIKNYVIEAGHSKGLGAAEDWTSRGKLRGRFAISPKHEAFMLGTTSTKHTGKEFQLFITTAPIPDLSEKLVVFGKVIKGEDVVQEIEEVDTDEHFRPKSEIGIINVTLKREV